MHYLLQNKHKVPPLGNIKMSIFRNSNILRGPKAKNSCKILSFQGKTPATGWPECHKQSSCWTYRQQDLKRILGPSPYLPSVCLCSRGCFHHYWKPVRSGSSGKKHRTCLHDELQTKGILLKLDNQSFSAAIKTLINSSTIRCHISAGRFNFLYFEEYMYSSLFRLHNRRSRFPLFLKPPQFSSFLFQQLCKHRIHNEIDGSRHDISDEISSTPLSYPQIHLTFSLVSLTRYASI